MIRLAELTKDPIFQLNVLLWLAQPLPTAHEITPLLHSRGFGVYAVALLLAPPPDVLLAIQNAGVEAQERARPDVILAKEPSGKFALTECKAQSFGVNSSTARQACTLLVLAGARCHEVLGLQPQAVRRSILCYLLPSSDLSAMEATLSELCNALRGLGASVGEGFSLGLAITDGELALEAGDATAEFFELLAGTTPFLRLDPDTDPRPLYFVPLDPDVEQSDEERTLGKRILFERIHGSVTAAVGRAVPPTALTIKSDDLLNDATFGMYGLWENRESAKYMRRLSRWLMDGLRRAIQSAEPNAISYVEGEGWKLELPDTGRQERVLSTLLRFSCEAMDLRNEPEPELFDGS